MISALVRNKLLQCAILPPRHIHRDIHHSLITRLRFAWVTRWTCTWTCFYFASRGNSTPGATSERWIINNIRERGLRWNYQFALEGAHGRVPKTLSSAAQSANSNLQTDFQWRVDAKTTLGSIIVGWRRPPHFIKTLAAAHLHNNQDHTNYWRRAVFTLCARMQIRNSIKSGRFSRRNQWMTSHGSIRRPPCQNEAFPHHLFSTIYLCSVPQYLCSCVCAVAVKSAFSFAFLRWMKNDGASLRISCPAYKGSSFIFY